MVAPKRGPGTPVGPPGQTKPGKYGKRKPGGVPILPRKPPRKTA